MTDFSADFSADSLAELSAASVVRPLQCPKLTLLPFQFSPAKPTLPVAFATFNALRDNYQFTTFNALRDQTKYPTFNDIMQGHPGFAGGPDEMPAGTGMQWGYEVDGVEWWITDAEGIEDSPQWVGGKTNPVSQDGTWPSMIVAEGRDITITGTLAASFIADLAAAKLVAASALAVPPHRGWLTYGDRRISVELAGPTRIKSVGALTADVQVKLRGIDVGTPGGGAFFESIDGATTTNLLWNVSDTVVVGGGVPTPPVITVVGPVPAGATISIGQVTITLTESVTTGNTLVIDCFRRRVMLGDIPRLSAVSLTAWPRMTPGANRLLASAQPTPSGLVRVAATPLY